MDREYYNEYYKLERTHWWFKVRSSIINFRISSLWESNKEIKILNIGSATGATDENLEKFGKVVSVEYDFICADETSKKLKID